MDETIHYRLCKMLYNKSYAEYNLPFFFNPFSGVVRPVAPLSISGDCLLQTLFPFVTFLTQGRLFAGMEVYPHPKLIYMERVMAALLVAVSSCTPALARLAASTGDARPCMSPIQRTTVAKVKGLVVLLMEYIPALFLCGLLFAFATGQTNITQIMLIMCSIFLSTYVGGPSTPRNMFGPWGRLCCFGVGGKNQYQGNAIRRRWVRLCWPVLVENMWWNPNSSSVDHFHSFFLTPTARTNLEGCHL